MIIKCNKNKIDLKALDIKINSFGHKFFNSRDLIKQLLNKDSNSIVYRYLKSKENKDFFEVIKYKLTFNTFPPIPRGDIKIYFKVRDGRRVYYYLNYNCLLHFIRYLADNDCTLDYDLDKIILEQIKN